MFNLGAPSTSPGHGLWLCIAPDNKDTCSSRETPPQYSVLVQVAGLISNDRLRKAAVQALIRDQSVIDASLRASNRTERYMT